MTLLTENYVTVSQAAALLKVSTSTLWRWINRGDLPAHRFGHRRVMIKQNDLDRMISPARVEAPDDYWARERQRLSRPLTDAERDKALAAFEAAQRQAKEWRERSGGQLFSDSVEIIHEMREERTKQLDDLR